MPMAFSRADGSAGFDGRSDLMARILISGSAVGDVDFLVLSNMSWGDGTFAVPAANSGMRWVRLIDSAQWAESAGNTWAPAAAATIAREEFVHSRSMVL